MLQKYTKYKYTMFAICDLRFTIYGLRFANRKNEKRAKKPLRP